MSGDSVEEELRLAHAHTAEDSTRLLEVFQQLLGDVTTWGTVFTVQPETSVAEAMQTMTAAHVGCVLVVEHERLVGIFTERDVLTKVATQAVDAAHLPVRACMTPEPLALTPNDTLVYALHAMGLEGYRHVPLVDEHGRPLAMVSIRTIIDTLMATFPQHLLNLPPSPAHERPRTMEGA